MFDPFVIPTEFSQIQLLEESPTDRGSFPIYALPSPPPLFLFSCSIIAFPHLFIVSRIIQKIPVRPTTFSKMECVWGDDQTQQVLVCVVFLIMHNGQTSVRDCHKLLPDRSPVDPNELNISAKIVLKMILG